MYQQDPRERDAYRDGESSRLADRLDKLSVPLAENVIRRAIELHHDQALGNSTIDVSMVEQIGAELGIGRDILRRALLEELQTDRDDTEGMLDRMFGPDRVSGGLVTRAEGDELDDDVEEWMRLHEGMRPRAKNGRSVRWERDPGLATTIRRGMKRAQGTGALRASPAVITRQTEVGTDEHLLEIEADTSKAKAESAGIGIAAAIGAVGLGGAVAAASGFAPDAVEFLVGFLPGIGAAVVGASLYARSRVNAMKDGINRALDGILHPEMTRRNDDRRSRKDRRRKPTWAHIIEEIVDEIFD